MYDVGSWNDVRAILREWYRDPEAFAEPGELDPPCRGACKRALHWIDDMQRDGNHSKLVPSSMDQGPNGEVHIDGDGWHMMFRETD